ncbi:undecaprenyldiphospho-muramoylpentapeptide beta-N-acetylglucosaminyltransferase [Prosthecobacter fluviatilis]|uniref:UDP-N-acetylglucosamine--N-acetylmuramyl-(pentapeptide) pyrophosphoryl-undecaprenol N-acetylglucosamine transferase n=1 Tax=Prosthecobacter fluviatilis TaxID=445931 RepID=A0ABW0KQQ6_9BACT
MKQKNSKSIHALIACGGTGGHLFPGIAVGEVLASRGHDVTLLISEKKIDTLAASGHPDLRFEKMPFLAMPKPWSPKMFGFLKGLWQGTKACRKIIADHDVDVVLGMGGFTSFAPLYAGRKEGCHTLIHESNAIPGKANRLNARYSDIVLCGLDACKDHFPKHGDVRVVGTPVRSSMRKQNTDDPHAFFKLDKDKRTLLVMGGSQGARGVNRAVGMALEQFEKMGIQVLHIAGPTDYEEVRNVYAKIPMLKQHVAAFCHRMDLAYRVADLAIARSGASSMSELAYFGVPSLLVPYPHAAEDHQTRNAEIFDKAGAAMLMPESDLNADTLADAVRSVFNDPRKAGEMKKAAQKLAVKNSAEKIADLLVKVAAS